MNFTEIFLTKKRAASKIKLCIKKVMMERSTHGIPEREGYSLKWSIGRVFVQNVPAMAVRYPQDAVWKVAPELEG